MEMNQDACVEMVEEIIENKTDELKANKCTVDDVIYEVCSILELKQPPPVPVVAAKSKPEKKKKGWGKAKKRGPGYFACRW